MCQDLVTGSYDFIIIDGENRINYSQVYQFYKKLENNIFGNKMISVSKISMLIEKI